MIKTIKLTAYDALTSQGIGTIELNVNHIVYLTDLIQMKNKRIERVKTRIHLSTGQMIDVNIEKEKIITKMNQIPNESK